MKLFTIDVSAEDTYEIYSDSEEDAKSQARDLFECNNFHDFCYVDVRGIEDIEDDEMPSSK